MPRYKPVHRDPLLLPVVLSEQVQPGTFEFALDHLVDHELDLTALDARFRNDETGASAYDPRVMLKIVLLAYSRGLITSRKIAQACSQNVLFMAISGDSQPSYTQIAKFVRELKSGAGSAFSQVFPKKVKSPVAGTAASKTLRGASFSASAKTAGRVSADPSRSRLEFCIGAF